jgi:hypothetical protein
MASIAERRINLLARSFMPLRCPVVRSYVETSQLFAAPEGCAPNP